MQQDWSSEAESDANLGNAASTITCTGLRSLKKSSVTDLVYNAKTDDFWIATWDSTTEKARVESASLKPTLFWDRVAAE